MGDEQSTTANNANNANNSNHDSIDFMAKLRARFGDKDQANNITNNRYNVNKNKKNEQLSIPKIIEKKEKLPTCPICFMEVREYIHLKNCNHLICRECLNQYISCDLKNISKYPLKCFQQNCDELLDHLDIKYALNNNQDDLFIFDKFSILCAISPNERETCPKSDCGMVFFYQSKWQRDKVKPFKWIDDDQRKYCQNKKCNKKFLSFIVRRHHCRICGEVFCDECSSNVLPLSASSTTYLKEWISKSNKSESPHNSINSFVDNIKKNITIPVSASTDLWSSSDEDDEEEQKQIKKWAKEQGVNHDKPNDIQMDEKKDLEDDDEKEEEKEFELSPSQQQLIMDERVRCCYECWLDHYRVICSECDHEYCRECRQDWHDNYDCDEIKRARTEQQLRKRLNDAQTEELMLREGWRRCAGCQVWCAKTEGCNHMTHENCPNPNDISEKKCHFCYCCGELLFDPYRKHEKGGRLHFEGGVFSDCRKSKDAKNVRDQRHEDAKSRLQEIENEFDENGIIIKQDKDCILM